MSHRLRSLPLIVCSTGFLPVVAFAGQFTFSPFTGDADSGINSGLTYTTVADFVGTGTRTVNGVQFANTGVAGTNYTLGLAANVFTGNTNNVTGVSNGLLSDFYYGDGSGNATLTLTGLTAGQSYVTSWYNAAFGTTARNITITPSDTATPYVFNENYTGNLNGNVLRYAFTATGTSISFGFDAVVNADSFHHYAVTNSLANTGLLTTPTITTAVSPNALAYSPFTPSNTDLLQTSLGSINSSTASGFTQEAAGGIPVLNNGSFTIAGGTNPNPQLATAGNGAFIEYNLNLAAAPLGFDISGIDTYGGWNDSGRDRQLLKLSYSLVGSSAFTYLGALDSNPNATTTSAAVRAQFPTNLTNVDAVRIEWFGGQENGYAGIGEIDVFGAATVPEPTTASVLALGGMVLLRRRRRA